MMQKIQHILLFIAVGLLLFSAGAPAQTPKKVFVKTPDGKMVPLSMNVTKALPGIKLLPTPHATLTKPIDANSGTPLALAASKVSYGGDGFNPGHAITIRVFSKAAVATGDFAAVPEFVDNTGATLAAPAFTPQSNGLCKVNRIAINA